MSGFVSFVGSGPGDPELLTLKAVDRLPADTPALLAEDGSGPDQRLTRLSPAELADQLRT